MMYCFFVNHGSDVANCLGERASFKNTNQNSVSMKFKLILFIFILGIRLHSTMLLSHTMVILLKLL